MCHTIPLICYKKFYNKGVLRKIFPHKLLEAAQELIITKGEKNEYS